MLVVDDYQPLADLLVGVLWNSGYEARAAYSAAEALSAIERFRPRAVVIDVILPDMDGFELAAEFERRFPSAKLLLTSAWDYDLEPAAEPKPYKVVNKSALMDELWHFLESCGPPGDL